MTRYLISDSNPKGERLEDMLSDIRKDVILRCTKIIDDQRSEARHVLNNNMKVLNLLSDAIVLADDSTLTLNKSFGPSTRGDGGKPRIGDT
ncbi:MAG: histidine kinase [Rhodospirillales bacterium]|nr:histidine kinase [Rhodospirillales bacterium]